MKIDSKLTSNYVIKKIKDKYGEDFTINVSTPISEVLTRAFKQFSHADENFDDFVSKLLA